MEEKNIRPDNLLEALGIDFKGLSDEARKRQRLLVLVEEGNKGK